MDWSGDGPAFVAACLRARGLDAFARALRTVPPGEPWTQVETQLRRALDKEFTGDAWDPGGVLPVRSGLRLTEGLARDLEVRDAKRRALADEHRARAAGAERPA
jgi:hypothetical protein